MRVCVALLVGALLSSTPEMAVVHAAGPVAGQTDQSTTAGYERRPVLGGIVIVVVSTTSGRRAGYGCVLGDGSLVAVPRHLAFEGSKVGLHSLEGLLYVISPHRDLDTAFVARRTRTNTSRRIRSSCYHQACRFSMSLLAHSK